MTTKNPDFSSRNRRCPGQELNLRHADFQSGDSWRSRSRFAALPMTHCGCSVDVPVARAVLTESLSETGVGFRRNLNPAKPKESDMVRHQPVIRRPNQLTHLANLGNANPGSSEVSTVASGAL